MSSGVCAGPTGRKVIRWAGALQDCNLELADLSGARAPGCDFSGSGLREAVLTDADLEGADLRRCDLFQALVAVLFFTWRPMF